MSFEQFKSPDGIEIVSVIRNAISTKESLDENSYWQQRATTHASLAAQANARNRPFTSASEYELLKAPAFSVLSRQAHP